MPALRITGLRATPINIPLERPMWWTGGHYPGTSKTIIEVETDQGLVGLGEAPSVDVVDTIRAMGDRLVGADALDIAGCESLCVPPWQIVQNTDDSSVVKAFGAIEIALWDLRGKVADEPLYRLLGGAVRKQIPFTEYFGFRAGRRDGPAGGGRLLRADARGTWVHHVRGQTDPRRSEAGDRHGQGPARRPG